MTAITDYPERTAKRVAVYPGSFDPITNGHLDLIERGVKIFDELVVAILHNTQKNPLFTVNERLEMLRECTSKWSNVRVAAFDGLLVDCARAFGAKTVLRGVRAVSDYECELQMAFMNRKLDSGLETVFMMPAEAYSYLSSRLVREIASLGGSLKDFVPASVECRLRARFSVGRICRPGTQRPSEGEVYPPSHLLTSAAAHVRTVQTFVQNNSGR